MPDPLSIAVGSLAGVSTTLAAAFAYQMRRSSSQSRRGNGDNGGSDGNGSNGKCRAMFSLDEALKEHRQVRTSHEELFREIGAALGKIEGKLDILVRGNGNGGIK